ncbi:MAG: T9SS type A sorting domain-containing protein [Psychroflexus halocasei]
MTWSYVESRDGDGDTNNSGINLPALMLRRSSDNSAVTSSDISGGIGNFSIKLYKGFTGSGNRQVELFVNGVSQGASTPFDDFSEHVFTVNNIDISGDVTIEIRNITGNQVIVDDISWTAYAGSSNDQTTEVYAPANQVAAKTVTAADITTVTSATDVFKFTVEDQGSGDGLPTNLSRVRLVPGPNNTANWSDYLQGFQVIDSDINIYTPTATISDSEILLDFSTPVSISDGGALDFEIFAYLKQNNIQDGQILQFQIEAVNHGFLADTNGSGFVSSFTLGDVVGNDITIDVEASQLSYLQQPSEVIVNEVMSPAVDIAYTDANNNIDIDYSGLGFSISMISSAIFNASATTTVEAVNGVAAFSNLFFDTEVTGVNLTAADDSTLITGTYDSSTFDVTAPISGATDLFFSEYIEGSSNNKYIEIYNGTGVPVNLSDYSVELYVNGNTTPNSPEDFTDPVFPISLNNGETLVIRNSSATIHPASVPTYTSSVANYNGNDAIALVKNGTVIDVIGEIGVDPGVGWDVAGATSATEVHTLVRKSDVCSPNTSWATSAGTTAANSEWTVYPKDDVSNLGSHTSNCGTQASVNYVYDGTSWSPNDPSGVSTINDNIEVLSGTTQFTADVSSKNLNINTGATLNLDSSIVLNIVNNLVNEGSLVFKSDATGTAQFDEFNGAISGIGDVVVERFIPAKRAFRFLSTSVGGQSFADAWQQGTHITGAGGAANGFDVTQTNNPSVFTFNNQSASQNSSDVWEVLTSASQLMEAGKAYRIMVRGDRTIDLNDQNATPTNTTLISKGSLMTNSYSPVLAQANSFFSFVGNPYQAIVDFSALTFTGDINTSMLYVWDPTLAGANGRGAYVAIDVNANSPSPSSSEANKFIMPGQAFFVQNSSAVNQAPGLTFTQAAKSTSTAQNSVFSNQPEFYINMRLYKNSALLNGESESDAIGLRFADDYTTPSSDEDASKMPNPGENFAIVNDKLTSIDNRSLPEIDEEIELFISGYEEENYVIQFMMDHQPEDLKVLLNDTYTENSIELSNDEVYTFNVDSNIPESIATDRFYVSFENVTMGAEQPDVENIISIYPNPANDLLKINTKDIEIEQLKLFNLQGQQLESLNFNSKDVINVSNLNSGIYILKIYTDRGTSVHKFIKK